jgi:hypothetical protein
MAVGILLYATQETSSETSIQAFQGHYVIGQEHGNWKLLRADLQQTGAFSPATTPLTQDQGQAQAVVQDYYQALNALDYHDAYQLWGAEYQSSRPYAQFAKGFVTTKHDDVTITITTQLSATVYRVGITLKTIEGDTSGTTTNTYSGSYIVGQENGSWKLLTADLQKNS